MLKFNQLVYSGVVYGAGAVYSDDAFNALLGQADEIAFQVNVEAITTGSSPVLTVEYQASNDDRHFELNTTIVNAVTISSAPTYKFATTTARNAGFGRLALSLDEGGKALAIKVYASGRVSTKSVS